jgi:hypothetical protein
MIPQELGSESGSEDVFRYVKDPKPYSNSASDDESRREESEDGTG